MKQQSKFSTGQEQATQQQQATQQATQPMEFGNSDELLRFDAAHTVLPPQIAERLKESSVHITPPVQRAWWKVWQRR
jgi:hypothetical protein